MHFTSISKVTAVISATKQLAATYPLQYPDHSPGADDLSIINTEKRMSEDPNLRKKGELLDHHHPFAGMSLKHRNPNKPNSTYSTMTPCDMFGNCKQLNLFKHSSLQAILIFYTPANVQGCWCIRVRSYSILTQMLWGRQDL